MVVELSAIFGSSSLADTRSELATVPTEVGLATRVMVAPPPLARGPMVQVNMSPTFFQVPTDGLAETKVKLAGRLSRRATALAAAGPWLVTAIKQLSVVPTVALFGLAQPATDRSANE